MCGGGVSFVPLPSRSLRFSGCAHAADPWSLIINLAQIRVAGGWGAAPPHNPLLPGWVRPPDPPKGAPRPWLQLLFAFSRPRHLSRAAAQPGAELSLRNPISLSKPLVRASCAAWGGTFLRNPTVFFFCFLTTCPGQLGYLGQDFLQNLIFF